MCRFWVIARQQSSEDGCFVRESLVLTLQPWLKDRAGCCCSYLTYLPLGNQTVANTQTLTSVPPFPPGLGSEVLLEALGAVGACIAPSLCRWQSALGWQTHTCCGSGRLPRAPRSASRERSIRNPNNPHISLCVLPGQWRPSEWAVERLWVLSGMGNERLCWRWCESL